MKYADLVQYIKDNHVNWNTDLFDVLRDFFLSQSCKYSPPPPPSSHPAQQSLDFQSAREFHPPLNGEYSSQDLLNLFST